MPPLSLALEKLESGKLPDVFEALLAVWRKSADPQLADLIVKLGAAVPKKIAEEDWAREAEARKSEALSALLASIKSTTKVMKERVLLLTAWAPDPRLDRWVVAQYAEPPFTSTGSGPFWTALKKLTVKLVDPVARAQLATLRSPRLDGVKLGPLPATTALSAEDRAAVAALEAAAAARLAPSKGQRSSEALLAEVLEKPTDTALRHVLMDALLETGHPRGQLLALQLKTEALSAAEKKREKALIAEHWDELLGPLAPALKPESRFARGFLVHAELRAAMNSAVENALEKARGHALWRTVESFSGEGSILQAGAFPVLRAVETFRIKLSELVRFATLEELTFRLGAGDLAVLSAPGNFPLLHSMTLQLASNELASFEAFAQRRTWRALEFTLAARDLAPYCQLLRRPMALTTAHFKLVVNQSDFARTELRVDQDGGKTSVKLELEVPRVANAQWTELVVSSATALLEAVVTRPNLDVQLRRGNAADGPATAQLVARVTALGGAVK